MTQQLHAIVARQRSVAERTKRELTGIYHAVQHAPTFTGGVRELVPLREDDVPPEPPEMTLPPTTAHKMFQRIEKLLTEAWDAMATRDRSNMDATGDIVVDGVRVEGVPISTLLSLEKHLADLRTVVNSMPVRDPSKVWTPDEDQGFHRAPEMRKVKTRKTVQPVVLSPATDRHPAQVQALPGDEPVGFYLTTEFSGAFSSQDKESIVDRLNKMVDAVRTARAEANRAEVTEMRLGAELLGYIFAR